MNNLFLINQYLTAGALAVLALVILTSFWRPKYMVFYYVALLAVFNSSTYGMRDFEGMQTLYSRGIGVFPVPFINIGLIAMVLIAGFDYLFSGEASRTGRLPQQEGGARQRVSPIQLTLPCVALLLYCFGHFAWGALEGISPSIIFDNTGIINLVNFILFCFIIAWTIRSKKDLTTLVWILMATAALRASFGLGRMAFGGDPANYYANMEQAKVIISFFDSSQSTLFFFCAAYLFLL
jgi:hypothetical protein